MDAVLFMEIRFYGHLRLRQASLSMPLRADIRFSAQRNPESHTLSIGSVQYFCLRVQCSILGGKSTS
jgi:hypothetical protein